jgi:predicted nucleic-acid-binding Zn-ribbon protein
VNRFGGNLGFSMAQAKNKGEDLVSILEINRKIFFLKKQCQKNGYSLKRFS